MSVATYRAVFQLLLRPHYWDKTAHFGSVPRAKPRPRWQLRRAFSGAA
jgi:hypothetical protein